MPAPSAPAGAVEPLRRALRQGVVVTMVALPVAVLGGFYRAGTEGVWGGLLGILLPSAFLLVTAVVALLTARSPVTVLGPAVLGSWLVKVVVLIAVLAAIRDRTFYDREVFFVVFAVTVVLVLMFEALAVVRTRVTYVEPVEDAPGGQGEERAGRSAPDPL